MIPDNVTLIVKAPNQQIEDQNIECQSSWTVKELKGHLSIVYPSKPRTEEQKIIYSGRLLDDNTVLKDVLRTYDSQIAHTMHLVCTNSRPLPTPASDDGLRRRNLETPERPVENRPETRQNDQNHTMEMQNYLSSFVNNYGRVPPYPNINMGEYLPVANDPNAIHNHMMMMQQAYLQYMQQYANLWQGTNPPPTTGTTPPPAPAPAPPPEEDEPRRDWLDHLYAASRLAVMLSLVYLYGSPARLLLVLLLAAAGYLHQIGFFRDLQMNPDARREAQNANVVPENVHANANVRANRNANANVRANPNVNADVNPVNVENVTPPNDTQQSILAVTWMIVTSFFASLIPETN